MSRREERATGDLDLAQAGPPLNPVWGGFQPRAPCRTPGETLALSDDRPKRRRYGDSTRCPGSQCHEAYPAAPGRERQAQAVGALELDFTPGGSIPASASICLTDSGMLPWVAIWCISRPR